MTNSILKSCYVKNTLYKKYISGLTSKENYINYKNKLNITFKIKKENIKNNSLIITKKIHVKYSQIFIIE